MRRKKHSPALPIMMVELMFASWETVARRTWLMAQGACPPEEYHRMIGEKALAAHLSSRAFARHPGSGGARAALAPWHRSATANAKRLRKS